MTRRMEGGVEEKGKGESGTEKRGLSELYLIRGRGGVH